MKQKMKTKFRGSITVEASFVLPITVFVLGALLLCTFCIHDRAVLQSISCQAASAGCNFATEKERSEAANEVQVNEQRLLGSRNVSGYAAVGEKETVSGWNSVYPIPGFAAEYFTGGQLNVSAAWTCKRIDPAMMIRKIRGAARLIGREEQ